MPVDFRYHLASIVAVFCALLIGILLGIALVGDPSLENQLKTWKYQHRRDSDTIAELRQSQENSRAFGKLVLPSLIDARLRGVRVAVILNRDLGDVAWVEAVMTTIRQAGGQITSVTSILPRFMLLKPDNAKAIFNEFEFAIPIEGELRSILAGKLAVRIAQGPPDLPFRLRRLGLIRVQGDNTLAADTVLLVGGAERDLTSVNTLDLPMIRALQENNKRVIACEAGAAQLSAMDAYQRRAITTVDNADTSAGQLALVLALAGASGNFGVKRNADDRLLPPLTPPGR